MMLSFTLGRWIGLVLALTALRPLVAAAEPQAAFATPEGAALAAALLKEANGAGKAEWRPVLKYLAMLHGRSVQPAIGFFPYAFESLGPGYMGGRAFGHWDLTHERFDAMRADPAHVRRQIFNELAGQQDDGLIPGLVTIGVTGHPGAEVLTGSDKPRWRAEKGFPPVWVAAVEAYVERTGDRSVLAPALAAAVRQIGWFEAKRSAPGGGFYYLDVVSDVWESGVDEGIRFLDRPKEPAACVDASAQVYMLYEHAARWSRALGRPADVFEAKAEALRRFIQTELWDAQTGFFYDRWTVREPGKRHLSFEGMWPVVVGAATPEQAERVIREHLLNSREFFTPHPLATVAASDPAFELRMWRGPVWNCMTFWAARGCLRYGQREAARQLLEKALDATAQEFARSGTIWEFYHPMEGAQSELKRKPGSRNEPCRDYVGHNPLFAMAELWRQAGGKVER